VFVPLNVSAMVDTMNLFSHFEFQCLDLVDDTDNIPPDGNIDIVDTVLLDDFRVLPGPALNLVVDSSIFLLV